MHRHRYATLLAVVCVHVTLLGLELPAPWTDLANLLFAPIYAGTLYAVRRARREAMVLWLLATIAPALNLAVAWGDVLALDLVKVALWTIAPAYLAVLVFVSIYDTDRITHEEILGAIAIYVLLGLVFANVYEALFLVDPQVLRFGDHFPGDAVGFGEVLYFSYVTLSTLGYGDVSPGHVLTRIVAVAQSIVGLMYMAVLVARFVGLHTSGRTPRSVD